MLDILYPIWKQTRLEYEEIFEEPCNLRKVWKEFVPWYGTDLEGRITILVIGDPDLADDEGGEANEFSFSLSPFIKCLRRLEDITLYNCRSISKELNNLPLLESLTFANCPLILFRDNILDEIQFDGLKHIQLCDIGFLSPPMLSLITNCLPTLESLEIYSNLPAEEDISSRQIVHILKSNVFCFQNSLKSLKLNDYSGLNEEILESIIFDIVLYEKFSILSEIGLPYNGIGSLTSIQSRILNKETVIPKNNLIRLDSTENPVIKKINDNELKEKAAILTILDAFNGISGLGYHYSICRGDVIKNRDVEYLLRINHAGRRYISGGGGGGGKSGAEGTTIANDRCNNNNNNNKLASSSSSSVNTSIKPQLWPKILERAYNKSDEVSGIDVIKKCATGMFHLIRNGSILQDIIEMRQQQQQQGTSSIDGISNIAGVTVTATVTTATANVKRGRKRRHNNEGSL